MKFALVFAMIVSMKAQALPYLQSYRCHDGGEPGEWLAFTLAVEDGVKVPAFKSYSENPFGERFGEVNYTDATATLDLVITAKASNHVLVIQLGEPFTNKWEVRNGKVEYPNSTRQPKTVTCTYVGANP